MDVHVRVRSARSDGESVHPVVRLGPPAIENRKVQPAIQDHLLAARARCLQGPPWIVQPDVHALHEMAADVDVVVFDEDELVGELRIAHQFGNLLQHSLAGLIVRMSLAGKNKLHRAFGIVHHRRQTLDVRQNQISSLVCRKAAGKSDSERIRAEYLAEPLQDLAAIRRGARPAPPRGGAQIRAAAISG